MRFTCSHFRATALCRGARHDPLVAFRASEGRGILGEATKLPMEQQHSSSAGPARSGGARPHAGARPTPRGGVGRGMANSCRYRVRIVFRALAEAYFNKFLG